MLKPALVLLLALSLAACGSGSENPKVEPQAQAAEPDSPGRQLFATHCAVCHQADGGGVQALYPPLRGAAWATGDKGRLIRLMLNGMVGKLEVNGEVYNNAMASYGFLSDREIADVLTYVRANLGNNADAVTPEEVAAVRAVNTQRSPWEASVLEKQLGIPQPGAATPPAR